MANHVDADSASQPDRELHTVSSHRAPTGEGGRRMERHNPSQVEGLGKAWVT